MVFVTMFFLPAGCREAANCRYCFYSQAKNQVFRPAGATRCTDSGQILHGRRPPRSAWLCNMLPQSAQEGGNAAQKFPLFGKESPRIREFCGYKSLYTAWMRSCIVPQVAVIYKMLLVKRRLTAESLLVRNTGVYICS